MKISFRTFIGATLFLGLSANAIAATATEFYNAKLDYYFLTSRNLEKQGLSASPDWIETGNTFEVSSAPVSGTVPFHRFFFPEVALNGTRGSHFYTANEADVVALKGLNPTNASIRGKPVYEGIDGYVGTAESGTCKSGAPIYRLFRGQVRFPDNPNHRFTSSSSNYDRFAANGYSQEGIAFCAIRLLTATEVFTPTLSYAFKGLSGTAFQYKETEYSYEAAELPSGKVACGVDATTRNDNKSPAFVFLRFDNVKPNGTIDAATGTILSLSTISPGATVNAKNAGETVFFGPLEKVKTEPSCTGVYRLNIPGAVCFLNPGTDQSTPCI